MRRAFWTVVLAMVIVGAFAPAVLAREDFDCEDFPNRAAAQQALETYNYDRWNLDINNNGRACENYDYHSGTYVSSVSPSASASSTAASASSTTSASASTSMSSTAGVSSTASASVSTSPLPHSGGISPVLAITSVLLIVGGGILYFTQGRRII